LVIYPALLAAAWALNQGLATEAEPRALVRPVLVVAALAGSLTVLAGVALRNRWDGALVAFGIVLVVILPFPLIRLWQAMGEQIGMLVLTVAMTAAVGVPVLIIITARKRGQPVSRPSGGRLNEFSILLLLVVFATNTIGDTGTAIARMSTKTTEPTAGAMPAPPSTPPDIVILVLDGYPRTDVLERRLGIDNSGFVQALMERDFDVATDSYSNYVFTALTLASMFQMQYLDEVDEVQPAIGSPGAGHDLLRHAAITGPAWATLRAAGYEIVTASPGWEHVSLADVSDRVMNDGHITQLERSLLEQTWVLDLLTLVAPDAITGSMQERLTGAFAALEDFAASARSSPAFLFLHVPAPHPPLLLDETGALLRVSPRTLSGNSPEAIGLTRDQYAARWKGELAYLNQQVIQAIDQLLSTNPTTVVIVMADHGYTQEVEDGDPEARLANFFAAHTPDAPGLLADAPTPVNLMSRLLNRYLGTRFQEHVDRFFLSPAPFDPLVLTELASPNGPPED
jgi:hypothetical protein